MSKVITIDPVIRISGFLEIKAKVKKNTIIKANASYIRDIMHGFEFIQNHFRHFYLLSMPSYAKISSVKLVGAEQYSDYRLPEKINKKIEEHYVKSIKLTRLAYEGLATLGHWIGTTLNNTKEPVEVGRIVRSFDTCVSCATHLIGSEGDKKIIEVLV